MLTEVKGEGRQSPAPPDALVPGSPPTWRKKRGCGSPGSCGPASSQYALLSCSVSCILTLSACEAEAERIYCCLGLPHYTARPLLPVFYSSPRPRLELRPSELSPRSLCFCPLTMDGRVVNSTCHCTCQFLLWSAASTHGCSARMGR